LCGFINAIAMTLIYFAFHEAFINNLNISLCSAILSVNCFYALLASICLFKENITYLQIFGTFVNVSGVIIITLFTSETKKPSGSQKLMIILAFIAATLMGLRIVIS